MTVPCPSCGDEYQQLSHHWRLSGCGYPDFSQRQKELLKGLAMGDGCVNKPRGESSASVTSINERWLRWLRAQFGVFATDVRLDHTGEQIGREARRHPEFDNSGGQWEYNDVHALHIRSHPFLTQMRERWYSDGEIRYPDDLHLTPVAAKAWYCSDGGLSWSDREHALAAFGTRNEAARPGYLCGLFSEHGFNPNWSEPLVRFTTAETADLLDWMGAAPAGFEYKWENESRGRYDEIKEGVTA